MTKTEKIKNTLKETRQRRKSQECKVYTYKIDHSHLTKRKQNYLSGLFREAKWLRNHYVASDDVFKESDKLDKVFVLNKDRQPEERELGNLSSQMKQGILDGVKHDIKGLSSSKAKGRKVGKLKFKSRVNSINLKQFDNTYKVQKQRFITLQGFKGKFRVRGLKQIPEGAEFANAKLLRKPSGYYIAITCFMPKVVRKQTGKETAFDFGIKDNITDISGKRDNWAFEETKRIKRLSRKINKHYKKGQKSSRNREHRKHLLRLEYEKLSNRKKDVINKFVSNVKTDYDFVGIQDENISEWKSSRMRGWGRKVHHSVMGGIISGIKKLPETQMQMIDRWEATTQECPICEMKNKLGLDERVYTCGQCGFEHERDVASAMTILKKAKAMQVAKGIHAVRMNTMPVEDSTSTRQTSLFGTQVELMKQEAPCFSMG